MFVSLTEERNRQVEHWEDASPSSLHAGVHRLMSLGVR